MAKNSSINSLQDWITGIPGRDLVYYNDLAETVTVPDQGIADIDVLISELKNLEATTFAVSRTAIIQLLRFASLSIMSNTCADCGADFKESEPHTETCKFYKTQQKLIEYLLDSL